MVLLGAWGTSRDIVRVQELVRRAEMERLRSHAVRTAGHLEHHLEGQGAGPPTIKDLDLVWLQGHWERMKRVEPHQLFACVVDSSGAIVAHTDPSRVGLSVSPDREDASGKHFLEAKDPVLTGDHRGYEVRAPITVKGAAVGVYRAALDAEYVDRELAAAADQTFRRWLIVMGGVVVVVVLAALSLLQLGRQAGALRQDLDRERLRQARELSRLVMTLAHEIRNPMNAIRLNLHASQKALRGELDLSPVEMADSLDESIQEVERVETLMRQLLGYARMDDEPAETIDARAEVRATVTFMQPSLDDEDIELVLAMPDEETPVLMAPGRLRQILLNLLTNAREACRGGGKVEVALKARRTSVVLSVRDSGAGVPLLMRERIFDPFFSTKATGAGIGLAIVRKFVRDAGGSVRCQAARAGGADFTVTLPLARARVLQEALV